MKLLIVLSVLIVNVVTSFIPLKNFDEVRPGVTCQYVASDVVFLFYSLKNPTNPIIIPSNQPDQVSKTHFDKSKETILLLHGGGGNSSGPLVQKCKTALVNAKMDVNIIGIDWERYQNRNKGMNIYDCGKLFGDNVGKFLKTMASKFGLQFSRLSLVGHSIGGGVIGDIGVGIGGQARSIVSLEACTYKDRAKFVQCMHTGNAAYSLMVHSNYFPNGGGKQPNCPPDPDPTWCNHWRSIDYFAESLTTNKFVGKECDNYDLFKSGKCNGHATGRMGGLILDTKGQGKFYLDTNGKPPYAKG